MRHRRFGRCDVMVAYAVFLHLTWAFCALVSPASLQITAMAILGTLAAPHIIALMLSAAAVMAVIGMRARTARVTVLLLTPQQLILMANAFGSLLAMIHGQFADGVIRSHEFLVADQSPAVLVFLGHSVAIYLIASRRSRLYSR